MLPILFSQPYETGTIIIPILEMRTLRFRKLSISPGSHSKFEACAVSRCTLKRFNFQKSIYAIEDVC